MDSAVQLGAWAAAVCVPVLVSWCAGRLMAMAVATMLLGGWCVAVIAWVLMPPPYHVLPSPLFDAVLGAVIFRHWRAAGPRPGRAWMLVIVALLMAGLALYVAYFAAFPINGTVESQAVVTIRHALAANILFAAMLIVTAWAGGVDDLVRRLWARLSRIARHHRHARAAP